MKKVLLVGMLALLLSSCASLKRAICDCQPVAPKKETKVVEKASKPVKLVKQNKTKTQESIVVDEEDLKLADRMTVAIDAYVFKDEEDEFKALCSESRFDCWVNEKRYPKGKAKIRRKVPPFLTGAKMGLRGEERIQVRFSFYP